MEGLKLPFAPALPPDLLWTCSLLRRNVVVTGADDGYSCNEPPAQCFLVLVPDITADTALSLEGKGRLDYHMSPNKKREYLMRHGTRGTGPRPPNTDRLEVKFRTRSENGVLVHVQESSNFTTVKVRLQLMLNLIWLDCLTPGDQNHIFPLLLLFPLQNIRSFTEVRHCSSIIRLLNNSLAICQGIRRSWWVCI